MSEPLIRVAGVGKKFCRSLKRSLWYGVRDLGSEVFGRSGERRLRKDEFWALQDVSFELGPGETLGLIGHNGAGKTTLLRMLTGLIRPDAGRIEIRGRLQALIALGAGFNPLLTGRENIHVNAAILGLSKKDIARLFDRIVDFAGIDEFLDMPVQSYSSGMAVRLGFSIAAHVDPDILLVDEVLSVGDLAFRTKCQVRIDEMRQRGVAIILVSHNLHTVSHICRRAIALDRGRALFDGDTERAIDVYRESLLARATTGHDQIRGGTGEIRVQRAEILGGDGQRRAQHATGDFVKIRIHYSASEPVHNPVFNVVVHILNGHQVTGLRTDTDGIDIGVVRGDGYIDLDIPAFNLLPNVYTVDAVIFHQDGVTFYDRVNTAAIVRVEGGLSVNGIAYLPHGWRDPRLEPAEASSSR